MLSADRVFPKLNTDHVEPLHVLEKTFIESKNDIEQWFEMQWKIASPPIYGSVDLRNAGFKLAPVDMNLFPAGFNNLNPAVLPYASKAAQSAIQRVMPDAKRILVIPENHTRNIRYWENIKILEHLLNEAGLEVRLASISPETQAEFRIDLADGQSISLFPLLREHDRLKIHDFNPDLILLNNDLSEGIPNILQNIQQPLLPPAELGWSQRLKSEHFHCYENVSREFAERFSIDPWRIAPLFSHCGKINFMEKEGLECVRNRTAELFQAIQKKYDEYDIPYKPFVVIKADAGTYGMAVMTLRDVSELDQLNRKQRTRMSIVKGGQPVNRVIIQEGVHTFEVVEPENSVAEPVVYMMGTSVIGGFYRIHKDRNVDENLNAPGMHFQPLAFTQGCHEPCSNSSFDADRNRFYTYGVIARLSMLAAAFEMLHQSKGD